MDYYRENAETWNLLAERYVARFMDLAIYNESYDAFCELLPEAAQVLDAGCGPGNISRYLLESNPELRVDGIDVAPDMIRLAQSYNPRGRFRVQDLRQLGVLTDRYDGIICGFALPYLTLADCRAFIRDSANLLRAQGVLYLSFVAGDEAQSGFQTGSGGERLWFNYHLAQAIEAALLESRFRVRYRFEIPFTRGEAEPEVHTVFIAQL